MHGKKQSGIRFKHGSGMPVVGQWLKRNRPGGKQIFSEFTHPLAALFDFLPDAYFFVKNRLDIFERPYVYQEVPIDKTFPKYLKTHKNKYLKYITPPSNFDENTRKLIHEIIRLRNLLEAKKDMENKYKEIIDSAFFKFYSLYVTVKTLFKRKE